MRKKIFFLILCGLLCLSACKSSTNTAKVPEKETSAEFFVDGELPDIGKYSAAEKYTRYYKEYTPSFIPQYDYGTLVPFIADNTDFSLIENDAATDTTFNTSSFGLCTTDGKIVTDAGYYSSITSINSEDGFDFYCLTVQNTAGDDVSDFSSTIIPSDGSWQIIAPANAWVSGASEGIIVLLVPVEKGNGYDIKFYDYKGRELFGVSGMDYAEGFSNGLCLVRKYSYVDGEADAAGKGNYCFYVNKNGKPELSQFADAGSFNEYGIAYASQDGVSYGLMDKTGKFVTEQKYSGIFTCGSLGWFQAINGTSRDIYSPDGILVKTVETENYVDVYGTDESNMIYSYYDNETASNQYFCLSDGKPFVCTETGEAPNSYIYLETDTSLFLHRDSVDYSDNSKSYIFDNTGSKICELVGLNTVCDISEDRKILLYVRGQTGYINEEYKNSSELVVYDLENHTEIKSFPGYSYAQFFGKDDENIKLVNYGNPQDFGGNETYSVYNVKENKMKLENCLDFAENKAAGKSYYAVCKKASMTLYDESFGTVLNLFNDNED